MHDVPESEGSLRPGGDFQKVAKLELEGTGLVILNRGSTQAQLFSWLGLRFAAGPFRDRRMHARKFRQIAEEFLLTAGLAVIPSGAKNLLGSAGEGRSGDSSLRSE